MCPLPSEIERGNEKNARALTKFSRRSAFFSDFGDWSAKKCAAASGAPIFRKMVLTIFADPLDSDPPSMGS
jgi:hypothetical protein